MFVVEKDMSIASVMQQDPEVAPVFLNYGMHCLYCPMASQESIGQASMVHGVDADALITDLNKYFAEKANQ